MRFMMMVKATADYENGVPPKQELVEAIAKLSVDLTQAGILLDAGGLLPSSASTRVLVSRGALAVTDGPFAETKELVGGYAILRADSRAEAIEHGKQFMKLHADILGPAYTGELEIRQLAEPGDRGGCQAEEQPAVPAEA